MDRGAAWTPAVATMSPIALVAASKCLRVVRKRIFVLLISALGFRCPRRRDLGRTEHSVSGPCIGPADTEVDRDAIRLFLNEKKKPLDW
jgi:hypothetical protein